MPYLFILPSVGFWDHRLHHVRKEAFTKWTITTGFLMAFILGCLSLYWGVFTHIEENLSTLIVYVVDFDGQAAPFNTSGIQPVVGPQIVQLAQQLVASPTPNLGYRSLPPSDFNYDPLLVRQAVYDWDAWAAIIVNPNATSMLYSAVQNGNASYDPMGACQLVYLQARDETNWSNYLFPHISQLLTQATSTVGQVWARQTLQDATSNQTLLQSMSQAPQAVSPAIGFSMYNLRPFYPYVATPAVSIGLIYLIIVSFFSFSFYLPIHFKVSAQRAMKPKYESDIFPVSQAGGPPASQILATCTLEVVRHYFRLFYAIACILVDLPRVPDQLLRWSPTYRRPDAGDTNCRRLQKRKRLRPRCIPGLLDAQLLRYDSINACRTRGY